MRILSININDFGGLENHLMEHKKYNAWVGRECIDWKYWSAIDKDVVFNKFLNYIEDKQPDVLIVNEMIVSPLERIDFISKIEEMGFSYFDETIPSGKYSFTMMFYKNMKCTLFASPNSGYRENRSILYFVEGIYVNGTHFPQESDTKFLNAVEMFCKARKNDKVIIIGDLNANDVSRGNKQLVERLKTYGYEDVWVQKGNPDDTVTEAKYRGRLDYAIASEAVYASISNMEIDPMPMDCGMTDHAAVIIDVV
ncbi:endonuclease/exonuclease/phosphatase family protein [Clostridium sp. L2-50]|uniref:endonuclease/exonuclease/phosphatase family protein n=1 Tax=Clostridium sp. L2-50 TaxID=411489 RepID=UPI00015BE7EF|nr:endonuclease/exonuclease/phosphatase family protein [Clostridium sp. L2-50]EDO57759.1 endonuclease/exonuclease/phosphatase family protein [Clostridium sp. L2-50]UEA75054.1 endonuclease/exonuclease/phosphatase family protein [Lachnospiraceae bacterium GAM79]UEA78247.1 endonuclease/exonuclease/phosphatase family protein [Lachnospiraceae bacterium GAM79]